MAWLQVFTRQTLMCKSILFLDSQGISLERRKHKNSIGPAYLQEQAIGCLMNTVHLVVVLRLRAILLIRYDIFLPKLS